MNQVSFDLRTPVSHRNDPSTSHEAEKAVTKSGQRKTHNEQVAWLVARYPGKTASELAALGLVEWANGGHVIDLIETRRRLSDMKGVHTRQGEARLGLLNKKEVTWYPL